MFVSVTYYALVLKNKERLGLR